MKSCVSLSGQYILLYVCLLAAAPGSRRLRPKGFPQHPGTSCLADTAPVVRMEKAYAQTRAAATRDGCWLWDLIFGCAGPPLNSAHLSYFLAPSVYSASALFFEESLKSLKSMSWQDTLFVKLSGIVKLPLIVQYLMLLAFLSIQMSCQT